MKDYWKYYLTRNRKDEIQGYLHCKKPTFTQKYKECKDILFQDGTCTGIGYEIVTKEEYERETKPKVSYGMLPMHKEFIESLWFEISQDYLQVTDDEYLLIEHLVMEERYYHTDRPMLNELLRLYKHLVKK